MTKKEGPEELVKVMVDRSGALWMASGGLEGISRFADGKLEMLGTQEGLASNDVREIFEDRSGDIWVGTISGLQQLHDGVFVSYTERDGLPAGHVQYDAILRTNRGPSGWGPSNQEYRIRLAIDGRASEWRRE